MSKKLLEIMRNKSFEFILKIINNSIILQTSKNQFIISNNFEKKRKFKIKQISY